MTSGPRSSTPAASRCRHLVEEPIEQIEQLVLRLGGVPLVVVAGKQLARRQLLEVDRARVGLVAFVLKPHLEGIGQDLAHLIAKTRLRPLTDEEDAQERVVDTVSVLLELVERAADVEQATAEGDRHLVNPGRLPRL